MTDTTNSLEQALKPLLDNYLSVQVKDEHSYLLSISNGISDDCAAVLRSDLPPRVIINRVWLNMRLIDKNVSELNSLLKTIAHHIPSMKLSLTQKPEYLAISSSLKQLFRFSDYRYEVFDKDETGAVIGKHSLINPEYTGLSSSFIGQVDQSRFKITLNIEVLDELTGLVETRELSHYGFKDWDANRVIGEASDILSSHVARFDNTLEKHLERFEETDWLDIAIEPNVTVRVTEKRTVTVSGHRRVKKRKGLLRKVKDHYTLLTNAEAADFDLKEKLKESERVQRMIERAKTIADNNTTEDK